MAEQPSQQPLTIQERIMLHLATYTPQRESYSVPREVTQAGIAGALGIRVAHASREVRKLVDSAMVDERDAAVQGARRHQKAYFLTPGGVQAAAKMRAEVGPLVQPPSATQTPGARGAVSVERERPALRYFFGRQEELDAARKILEGRGVLVIIGIAGIGKSTIGAKLFEEEKAMRSCVWYTLHEYDTPMSVLQPVAQALALQGRPKLELLAKREATVELPKAKDILLHDVQGLSLVAFFDDAQAASPEALQALRVLREVASAHPKAFKLVLLSRARPPIYDARDVTLKKSVGEVELRGLRREDALALLSATDKPVDASAVYEATGGHPLFIELMRDAGESALSESLDRREIDRFVQDQIFSKLNRGEREALRRIAFVRRPVDPRVVLAPPASLESVLTLEARSLVRRDARGRVLAHEAIRDFVKRTLTEEEERDLSESAYRAILAEVEQANQDDDPGYAIALLEDALALAPNDDEIAGLLVRLGGFHLAVAQYNQAAVRLEEALTFMGRTAGVPLAGLAHFLLGAVHSEAGHRDISRRHLDDAARAMERPLATVEPERGRLYLEYAKWETRYGTAAEARKWVEKGIRIGQALNHDFILADAEMLLSHLTPARESNEHLERCVALAKRHEFTPMLSLAHSTYSWHLVDLFGDTEHALEHASEGLKAAEALGNKVLTGMARAALAKARWRSGDLPGAREEARLGMATAEKNYTERIVPIALLSTLETESGDPKAGETLARDLLQAAEKYGTPTEVLAAKRALARALDVQGRYDEAVPLLESCHEVYTKMALSCDAPNHIATLDRLIRMEVARGNRPRADHWFELAKTRLPEVDSPVGGALQNMAFAHLRQLEAPALSATYYWRSAETWRTLRWRLLELKMLVDCVNAIDHAAKAGEAHPSEVPKRADLETRIDALSLDLKVPRPKPLHGAPVA